MVAPVTGPYSETTTGFMYNPYYGWNTPSFRKTRTWYRQRKPFNLPLPYSMTCSQLLWQTGLGNDTESSVIRVNAPAYLQQALYNAAYTDFISGSRGIQSVKSELGATLGEWRSSSSMIATRANQLIAGLRAAKRGDVSGVKRAWGKHAGIRRRARASGSLVLEYSFGWAPLIKDLNAAVAVLHNRVPALRAYGRKRISGSRVEIHDLGSVSNVLSGEWQHGVSLRALVRVTNPNTLLAQQLGLINLGSVLWELTPNSYIVDYFFNVGQFLGSFTDRVGVELEGESHTFFSKLINSKVERLNPGYGAESWWTPHCSSGSRVTVTRYTGIPRPRLSLNLPWNMSVQRASTSIARLLQLLKGK